MTLPIRVRLTLWYGTLLAGAFVAFSVAVYLIMARTLLGNLDTTMRQRIDHVQSIVKDSGGNLSIPHGEEQLDEPFIPAELLTPSGRVLSGSLPQGAHSWLARQSLPRGTTVLLGSESGIRLGVQAIERHGRLAGYVLVWQSLQSVDDARHSLLLVLLGVGPLLLLIACVGGYLLARRALRPVAGVTHAASAITATDLRQRVTVSPARDELTELATTFNAMIDRLEAGVDRERRFTADASHELRSPLAVIRAEASLALERPRSPEEYRRMAGVVDSQASMMEDMIAGLLLLARLDTLRGEEREPLELAEVVHDAIARAHPSPIRQDVTIESSLEPELVVWGSRSLLILAVRNLLENAVKSSPSPGTVQVTARREGDRAVISVLDQGPGIPPELLDRIFEPFYQVAEARTPGESHGLGLAICRRIIEAHSGTVSVASMVGYGACFEIVLSVEKSLES